MELIYVRDGIISDFEQVCRNLPPEKLEEFTKEFKKLGSDPKFEFENKEADTFYHHIIGRLMTKPFNIENSFQIMKEREWDYFYVYVDIHGTILKPDYDKVAKEYYPMAEETLQMLTKRKDVSLILYTCSYQNEISEYLDFFADSGIQFDGINRAEVKNTRGGDFTDKPYFNVLHEDKAGFIGELDWYIVNHCFNKFPERLNIIPNIKPEKNNDKEV